MGMKANQSFSDGDYEFPLIRINSTSKLKFSNVMSDSAV